MKKSILCGLIVAAGTVYCGKKSSKKETAVVAPPVQQVSKISEVKVSNYQMALQNIKAACDSWVASFGTQEIPFSFTNAFGAAQPTKGTYQAADCITDSDKIYMKITRITGGGSPYSFSFVLAPDAATNTYSFVSSEMGECNEKVSEAFIQGYASQFAVMTSEFREAVRLSVTQSFCPTQAELLKSKIFEIVKAK